MDVIVTKHAWQQYCLRVDYIDRDELTELLQQQLRKPHRRKRDFVQLDGVWWVFTGGIFITCYGRTHIDLPAALTWAALHKDRIVL